MLCNVNLTIIYRTQ